MDKQYTTIIHCKVCKCSPKIASFKASNATTIFELFCYFTIYHIHTQTSFLGFLKYLRSKDWIVFKSLHYDPHQHAISNFAMLPWESFFSSLAINMMIILFHVSQPPHLHLWGDSKNFGAGSLFYSVTIGSLAASKYNRTAFSTSSVIQSQHSFLSPFYSLPSTGYWP